MVYGAKSFAWLFHVSIFACVIDVAQVGALRPARELPRGFLSCVASVESDVEAQEWVGPERKGQSEQHKRTKGQTMENGEWSILHYIMKNGVYSSLKLIECEQNVMNWWLRLVTIMIVVILVNF